jgi:hypothetical protein
MKEYLEEQSGQRGFRSVEACVLDILEANRLRELKKKIEAEIRESLKSPSLTMTRKHWDRLKKTIAKADKKNGPAAKNKGKGLPRTR